MREKYNSMEFCTVSSNAPHERVCCAIQNRTSKISHNTHYLSCFLNCKNTQTLKTFFLRQYSGISLCGHFCKVDTFSLRTVFLSPKHRPSLGHYLCNQDTSLIRTARPSPLSAHNREVSLYLVQWLLSKSRSLSVRDLEEYALVILCTIYTWFLCILLHERHICARKKMLCHRRQAEIVAIPYRTATLRHTVLAKNGPKVRDLERSHCKV